VSGFTVAMTNLRPSSLVNPSYSLRVSFEKNYRLQDIQLSKIRRRAFALRRDRFATRVAAPVKFVVENTGLEPVTSWLQTRRSPS
jgi:hypothetical protein